MTNKLTQARPAHVLIDQAAMQHNLARVRELCPSSSVMAVIKADAYGHGMEVAADALAQADQFAVNSLDDVLRLRGHGVTKPITVLSASMNAAQLTQLADLDVQPVIYDHSQLPELEKLSSDITLSVWLKVDTGMGRLGFAPNELAGVRERLANVAAIKAVSLMTHLANADQAKDTFTRQQLDSFKRLSQQGDYHQRSALNSGGVCAYAEEAFDVVRPGVMLYGISPLIGVTAEELGLKPAMTFKSQLISVKTMPAGSSIGYGRTYVLEHDADIGIIACGYGDGYPRHAVNGTPVVVNGESVPLLGRVSMDMLAVNLDGVSAEVGDDVVLWGAANPIETVAEKAGTIGYELACGILPRVERIRV